MKVVFALFDSLNRRALSPYGPTTVDTPNFQRFAERAVTFDTHYVGSLPCMPARRDMHTGRLNFLHRSWGPLEPFDESFSELLRANGGYTHLVSDHYHYWEDGGATYHQRYSSWDFIRGQEWDKWKAMVQPPLERFREMYHDLQFSETRDDGRIAYMINREFIRDESEFPCPKTIGAGLEFLDINREADDWLLQIECFDPHEPFFAPARFREKYPSGYQGPILDWPRYQKVNETPEEIAELRANYAALVNMCDHYFGVLLDYFDRHDLWSDTALVLTTDHGFLLSEHDWWGKNRMPFYEELSRIPLIVHHPDFRDCAGERRQALTQTADIMPTFLDWFGVAHPGDVEGRSLNPVLATDERVREAALFGMFGAGTNITDGRYTYFRYPPDMTKQTLYEYTLLPTHQKSFFTIDELVGAQLHEGFPFTKGVPVLQIPARRDSRGRSTGHVGQGGSYEDTRTVLYDLETDPGQSTPIQDGENESRLIEHMFELMRRNHAPPEAFERLAFPDL